MNFDDFFDGDDFDYEAFMEYDPYEEYENTERYFGDINLDTLSDNTIKILHAIDHYIGILDKFRLPIKDNKDFLKSTLTQINIGGKYVLLIIEREKLETMIYRNHIKHLPKYSRETLEYFKWRIAYFEKVLELAELYPIFKKDQEKPINDLKEELKESKKLSKRFEKLIIKNT